MAIKNKLNTKKISKGIEENNGGLPTRVWVSVERKLQISNYEPISVTVGLSTDVEENQTIQEAYDKCFYEIKKALIPQIKQLQKLKNRGV